MDTKQYVREFLRAHQGVTYSHTELAVEINEYQNFDTPLKVNADEVLTHALELAEEIEKIHHYTTRGTTTALINGERRTLFLDDEYLRYDVVADLAEDRLEEVRNLHREDLLEWIIEELADEIEDSVVEHHFEYEGRGWGGPD